MAIETQENRDAAIMQAFRNLMDIVRSLGATGEQCESVIEEIVTYGHHYEWSGWYRGFNTGYVSGKERERSYHV
jgi:hypothetical protein